jgi:hypothetical protein
MEMQGWKCLDGISGMEIDGNAGIDGNVRKYRDRTVGMEMFGWKRRDRNELVLYVYSRNV